MGGHQHWPPHHDTNWYDPCPLPTGPAPTTFRSGGVLTTCAHFSPTTTTPLVWHPTRDRARAVRRSGARHKADPCSTPQNLSGGLLRASGGLDTGCLYIFAGLNQRAAVYWWAGCRCFGGCAPLRLNIGALPNPAKWCGSEVGTLVKNHGAISQGS